MQSADNRINMIRSLRFQGLGLADSPGRITESEQRQEAGARGTLCTGIA